MNKGTSKQLKKLSFGSGKNQRLFIFVLLFAALGVYMLLRSFAASYPTTDWAHWAPRIRYCESGNNYQAQNSSSSASGAWQIINGTWNNYKGYAHAKDAPNNIQDEKAYALFQSSGTQPWAASYSCWQNGGRADNRPQPDPPLYIPAGGGSSVGSGGSSSYGCDNHPTIRQSNTGGSACVKHLQDHLNKTGFGYNLTVDGGWGTLTNNAVKDFQRRKGLTQDGVVGPNTWNALHSGISSTPSPSDGSTCTNPAPSGRPDRLTTDQNLLAGEALVSSNGQYSLFMQGADANLVLRNPCGKAIWSSGKYATNANPRLTLQRDGNLVIYGNNGAIWGLGSTGKGGVTLLVQNDGNLVLYSNNGAVWGSDTVGR